MLYPYEASFVDCRDVCHYLWKHSPEDVSLMVIQTCSLLSFLRDVWGFSSRPHIHTHVQREGEREQLSWSSYKSGTFHRWCSCVELSWITSCCAKLSCENQVLWGNVRERVSPLTLLKGSKWRKRPGAGHRMLEVFRNSWWNWTTFLCKRLSWWTQLSYVKTTIIFF